MEAEEELEVIRHFLENGFWPKGIKTEYEYSRLHDAHEGTHRGRLIISFGDNGDAMVTIDDRRGEALSFRTNIGGGQSVRTRNALFILAMAMEADDAKHKQLVCVCPSYCDCEYPPPENWDGKNGSYRISDFCPVHNENPRPYPGCPAHGDKSED